MSLFDIAPQQEAVMVFGTPVWCRGVSMKEITALLGRFPALRTLVFGPGSGDTGEPASLIREVPEAIAPLIAAGTGNAGDAKAEAIAGSLPIDSQLDLLAAIFRQTMPDGIGPLARKLTALFGAVGDLPEATEAASATVRPPQPNGADSNSSMPLPSSA